MKRILFVDDDRLFLDMIHSFLNGGNYAVERARYLIAANQAIRPSNHFDLIIVGDLGPFTHNFAESLVHMDQRVLTMMKRGTIRGVPSFPRPITKKQFLDVHDQFMAKVAELLSSA